MGDLGYVDSQGFLYIIDRKKDIFKCGGHHINPSEIESVIQLIDGVKFVSVVGVANPLTYNLITAVVERKKGFEMLTESQIIEAVARELPAYKQLNGGVYFVDEMPRTVTGKIIKRTTKEIAEKRFAEKSNC
jgi:4-coumarate--CoA ligase